MAPQWERWLRYAKAKLDDTVKRGDAELDKREAEQRARAEDKPWLASTAPAPTLDEARARIEHQADQARPAEEAEGEPAEGGAKARPALATDPQLGSIDFAAQQKAADERLAKMRDELGLDEDPPPSQHS